MNRALAWLLVAFLVFFAGFGAGKRVEHNANEARRAEAQQTAIELHNAVAIVGQRVERKAVERTAQTAAVFNGINQGAITYAQNHPVSTDCSLDDDGLRLWTAANTGADAQPAGSGTANVPDTASTAERPADGSADKSHRGGGDVSPMPRSALRAGAVAGGNP